MDLSTLFLLLLPLSVLTQGFHYRTSRLPSWETPKLPEIKHVSVHRAKKARFHGHVSRGLNTSCGMECQKHRSTKPIDVKQMEEELSFESLDLQDFAITNTLIEVGDVPSELFAGNGTGTTPHISESQAPVFDVEEISNEDNQTLHRRKRNIFGLDTRFSLSSRRYMTMYPFTTAVKLSTGCSGILLSPKHVLTSAHCIHDGKRYVKGVRKLKIGKLMKTRQKRGKGKRRNRGKKGRKNRRNRPGKNNVADQQEVVKKRTTRDLSLYREDIAPYFKWVRAKKTHLPQGWLNAPARGRKGEFPIEYDYAVVELKRALGTEYMDIGICPERESIPSGQRIHFTGFDTDRSNRMLYRFCPIEEESPDLMYHYCDAQEGTSGSGIYIRLYDKKTERWARKVVAVFSGHQLVNFPNGAHKEFNTGVRITPLKYAQICFWTKGSYDDCRGG